VPGPSWHAGGGACLAVALLWLAPAAPAAAQYSVGGQYVPPATPATQYVPGCGALANAFGPFDYADPAYRGFDLHIVEIAHFTDSVRELRHGNTSSLIGDLDYTLRAFPNHYLALQDIARYALQGGKFLENRPPECYFKRAIAFRPDDAVVRTIYGNYLLECSSLKGEIPRNTLQCGGFENPKYMDPRVLKEARSQYEAALKLAPTQPDINYDAGLFFFDIGELGTAQRLADVAYRGGFPLMGLKRMLAAAEGPRASRRAGATKPH
jgi:tetratricopeptide (TPR) repeat protein